MVVRAACSSNLQMVLRSPRDGIVEKVSTSEGSQVSEKSALVTLVDEDDDDEVD